MKLQLSTSYGKGVAPSSGQRRRWLLVLGLCLAAGLCTGVAIWSSRVGTDKDEVSAPGQSSTVSPSKPSSPSRAPTRLTVAPTSPAPTSTSLAPTSPTAPTLLPTAQAFNYSSLRLAVDSYCSNDPSFEVTYGATSAWGDISTWDVSRVTDMSSLFEGKDCNPPIANWNISSVLSFSKMFKDAVKFNQPISSWQTGAATTMTSMFENAIAFNEPLAGWDVSRVTSFDNMFFKTSRFDQRLCWSIRPRNAAIVNVFEGSSCPLRRVPSLPGPGVVKLPPDVGPDDQSCWNYCCCNSLP
jgi:hypothetical protein